MDVVPHWLPARTLLLVSLLIVSGVWLVHAPARAQPAGPPPAVVVAPVVTRDVSASADFFGRVQAIQTVDLTPRVEGYLDAIKFQEGSFVKKGQLLFQIEKAPYQAALDAAQAQLAAAKAQVSGAQATLKNAQINLTRQLNLVAKGTVSQKTADDAQAQRDTAVAQVEQAQAAVQQAQAQIETAKLNLSYTDIVAPIDGRIGAVNVTVGNLVSTTTGTLATIVQVTPIRVAFSIPDSLYVSLIGQKDATSGTKGRDLFTPRLTLPNGKAYAEPGDIGFVGNQISTQTGTLTVYAQFPNALGLLLPGSFVSVNVAQAQPQTLPVVPASAILQDQQGRYVFVLDSDNRAQERRIETGQRLGAEIAVTKGLREGETIVVDGVQKVTPGAPVTPNRAQTSAASAMPAAASALTVPAAGAAAR